MIGDKLILREHIQDEVPAAVLDKLSQIPYCVQAYGFNGLASEQFNDHPATVHKGGLSPKLCSAPEIPPSHPETTKE